MFDVRRLVDHGGNVFDVGETLAFRSLDSLPHDEGYTLHFEERGMWIDGTSDVYADFGLSLERG